MKKIAAISLFCLLSLNMALSSPEFDFDYKDAKLIKKESNKEVYQKPNGMIIEKYADREVAELKGAYRIIRHKNGERVIYLNDGLKIIVKHDGAMEYHYPNGKRKDITMDGKTPYGIEIKKHQKSLKIKELVVVITYSPELSDNNLTKYTKKLYEALVSAAYRWMEKNKKLEKRIDIVISNCRFIKTGYCKRKGKKEIEISSFIDGKKHKTCQVQHVVIFKEKNIHVEAKKIIEMIIIP